MAKRGGWYGEPKRHAAAARGVKTGRTLARLIRFSKHGDALDGSGMHITDFEDEDLTNFELRQKYLSLLEGHEYETARIVARDMRARKMDVPGE